ncbi:MAG: Aspartate--tRNA(Asp/Asn) ligase [Chlamydiae bacterium]|nr:Aspartate--tRNA(Asp/Asn) ligase [Chlamydiota bacterium]
MKTHFRTHTCGELRSDNIGQEVKLSGFVHRKRDLGNLFFIDLRDQYGLTQLIVEKSKLTEKISHESVISIEGKVKERISKNKELATGNIEVEVKKLEILSHAKTLPFEITSFSEEANEELRLKYRYLELRRGKILQHLQFRHRVILEIRNLLSKQGFIEVQTPILGKSTPEGARDYLVPSRLYPGHFFALPQSPQQFKQLLMMGNMDRYFQIPPCFRDEDLRADRQPEFYQIDIEMSFGVPEDLFAILETFMKQLFKNILNTDIKIPFKRLSFHECMEKYGCDKPDLRFGMELKRFESFAQKCDFSIFKQALEKSAVIKGLCAPGAAHLSRKNIEALEQLIKNLGLKGLSFFKVEDDKLHSSIAKFFTPDQHKAIIQHFSAKNGDLILLLADKEKLVNMGLDQLRRHLAKELDLISNTFAFLWVTDFPLFEWDEEEQRYFSMHHPFTAPNSEDLDDLPNARSTGYDLVLNGYEIAGGSKRIHSLDLQYKIFELLGLKEEEIKYKFGHFIEALSYGCPPHLGIAFGLDRLLMTMLNTDNIRDVIAFPKTTKAQDLMLQSPSQVSDAQLKELHIKVDA